MSETAVPALLQTSLQAAVPLWIMEISSWSVERRMESARECADVVAAHGDDLQYGGKHCAETFNKLALGLACLAYVPGGVRFLGDHWNVEEFTDSSGHFTEAFLEHLRSLGVSP